MRVLFDLVHPADALFFHHAIRRLQKQGVEVCIASREKDVLVPLLDALGHGHRPITRAGQGAVGLGLELVRRDWRLLRLVRSFRPDAMVGFGGVAISHAGALTGIPSLSFYDTEHAALQLRLALPFISEWHVPESWQGVVAPGRTFRFAGGKQSAYLHPDHFVASKEIAAASGWNAAQDNFLIRTVAWKANHDHGRSGLTETQLREAVTCLSSRGRVHISAEGELPGDLEPMRFRGSPTAFHHLLGHCRLHVGESITVASEAVMLGVPALLQIDKEYGYVAEQEAARLIRRFGTQDSIEDAIASALEEDPSAYRQRAREFAAARGDVNLYIVSQIERVLSARSSRKSAAEAPVLAP